jgi:hypothetical protein
MSSLKTLFGKTKILQIGFLIILFSVFVSFVILDKKTDVLAIGGGSGIGCESVGGGSGSLCNSGSQCQPGLFCAGGSGAVGGDCSTEQTGTCQSETPAFCPAPGHSGCTVDSQCNQFAGGVCNIYDDIAIPGCQPFSNGICSYSDPLEQCTTGVPAGPNLSGGGAFTYNSDNQTLTTKIPGPNLNGGGDFHHLKIVLASQATQELIGLVTNPIFELNNIPKSSAPLSIIAPFVNQTQTGIALRVGVQNYDSCQGIWGPWEFSQTVTVLKNQCFANPPIPATFQACEGDDTGLVISTTWKKVAACTPYQKCEYTCPAGQSESGGVCVPSVCGGTMPAGSTMCVGDNTGILSPSSWKLSASCTDAVKCESYCAPGTVESAGACVPLAVQPLGNVYGYAWSPTIGWIKMNECEDVSPFDGLADNGCVSDWGVRVNNTHNDADPTGVPEGGGLLSGYAWNNSIGWIKFGGLSGFPSGTGTYSGNAELLSVTETSGIFRGWARAITGGTSLGWDGWISLADSGGSAKHPSGAAYIDGSRGVTYDAANSQIVGSAWGSQVLGWIKFSGSNFKTTYGKGTDDAAFDYAISANPTALVIKQNNYGESTIFRTLLDGSAEEVTLTASIVGGDPGNHFDFDFEEPNPSDPATPCAAGDDCSSVLTINVGPDTPVGSYAVRVVGTSESGLVRDVYISVDVNYEDDPFAINVTCVIDEPRPYSVNKPVKWKAVASGGVPGQTYTFQWSGSNGLSCQLSDCQTLSDSLTDADNIPETSELVWTYNTTGKKEVKVDVNFGSYICTSLPNPGESVGDPFINVVVDPKIDEF